MPVNYPSGIVEEHLYTRTRAGLFDVCHMGRFVITGKEATPFLQYVLTNNALALDLKQAQYTMIPNENGGALDDAYLYRFYEDEYLLVVNASNAEKDWAHLTNEIGRFDARSPTNLCVGHDFHTRTRFQEHFKKTLKGPLSDRTFKNALNIIELDGKEALIAKTGYTGEPIGFELFVKTADAVGIWTLLLEKWSKASRSWRKRYLKAGSRITPLWT